MKTNLAISVCLIAAAAFLYSHLSLYYALSFTSGVWMFTGYWLDGSLKRFLGKIGPAQGRAPDSPIARTMVNGGVVLAVVSVLCWWVG